VEIRLVTEYTYRLWHVRRWQQDGFLELRNVTYGWKLNDIGSFEASMPLQRGPSQILPGQHAIIVERDGEPVWMGPVWSVEYDTQQAYLRVTGSEWSSYLRRRRIRFDLSFAQADQFDIARQIIQYSQSDFSWWGDLHIDVYAGQGESGRTLSGVLRDRTYSAVERQEVWQNLMDLGDLVNGFDQRLRPMYVGGDPVAIWWEGFYPREGPSELREDLIFEYRAGWPGSNVTDYKWSWDASDMVNVADATSSEQAATATDSSSWDSYPLLEGLAQFSGVEDTLTLQDHANAAIAKNRLPLATGTLTLRPGWPELAPDLIGSRGRLRLTSWMHPPGDHGEPGFDDTMRVEEVTVNAPSDERAEETTITLTPILYEEPPRDGSRRSQSRRKRPASAATGPR
jgi:hypothetical protein